jgi:hypothetical protein
MNIDLDLNRVVASLEQHVDTDGKTFVLFWLYSPTTSTTGPASLTKINPDETTFVCVSQATEDILLPYIPPEPGLWEVRFTIMAFDEAKAYAEKVQLDDCFEEVWKKETKTCH